MKMVQKCDPELAGRGAASAWRLRPFTQELGALVIVEETFPHPAGDQLAASPWFAETSLSFQSKCPRARGSV